MKSDVDEVRGFLKWLRSFAVYALASSRVTKHLDLLQMFLMYDGRCGLRNWCGSLLLESWNCVQALFLHLTVLNRMRSRFCRVH
jgi:hypothetical protein